MFIYCRQLLSLKIFLWTINNMIYRVKLLRDCRYVKRLIFMRYISHLYITFQATFLLIFQEWSNINNGSRKLDKMIRCRVRHWCQSDRWESSKSRATQFRLSLIWYKFSITCHFLERFAVCHFEIISLTRIKSVSKLSVIYIF